LIPYLQATQPGKLVVSEYYSLTVPAVVSSSQCDLTRGLRLITHEFTRGPTCFTSTDCDSLANASNTDGACKCDSGFTAEQNGCVTRSPALDACATGTYRFHETCFGTDNVPDNSTMYVVAKVPTFLCDLGFEFVTNACVAIVFDNSGRRLQTLPTGADVWDISGEPRVASILTGCSTSFDGSNCDHCLATYFLDQVNNAANCVLIPTPLEVTGCANTDSVADYMPKLIIQVASTTTIVYNDEYVRDRFDYVCVVEPDFTTGACPTGTTESVATIQDALDFLFENEDSVKADSAFVLPHSVYNFNICKCDRTNDHIMDFRGTDLGCQEQNRPHCTLCPENTDPVTLFEGCKLWDTVCDTTLLCEGEYNIHHSTTDASCIDISTGDHSDKLVIADSTGMVSTGVENERLVVITVPACPTPATEYYNLNHEKCMTADVAIASMTDNCYAKHGGNCDQCVPNFYTDSNGDCVALTAATVTADTTSYFYNGDFVATCPTGTIASDNENADTKALLYAAEFLSYIQKTSTTYYASSWRMSVTLDTLTVLTCKCNATLGYLWNASTQVCERQNYDCSASCVADMSVIDGNNDCVCTQCPITHAHVRGSANECLVLPSGAGVDCTTTC
jgi:hypothetical protein